MSAGDQATSRHNRRANKRKSDHKGNVSRAEAIKPGLAARQVAHRLMGAIIDAHTPMDALTDDAHGHPHYLALDPRDRSLVRALLMAALRHRPAIDHLIGTLLDKPLPAGASAVGHILHIAATQIFLLDVPDHSAVDLAAEACSRDPRTRRFTSLVNALARRMVREKAQLQSAFASEAHIGPEWFVAMLSDAYGAEKCVEIMAAHRLETPVDLSLKRDQWTKAEVWAETLDGIVLGEGIIRLPAGGMKKPVPELNGFADGHWWIQDAAASIPARLFGDLAGRRVLDACAAPGGKTAQLADAGAEVTALDMSKNRLGRLSDNMARLGLSARVTPVVSSLFDYEPDEPFDAVLLDAPCSSTGTVRRHPDVPWAKTPQDVAKLADLQARMLVHAAHLVAPGGVLVFSNCSLDPSEGELVTDEFLKQNQKFDLFSISPEEVEWIAGCVTPKGTLRTTPAALKHADPALGGLDGFYAARFRRAP